MNIGSDSKYPASKLSNFTGFEFTLYGEFCASAEGCLQSFKYENLNAQMITRTLVGKKAKFKGKKRNKHWKQSQTLFFKDVTYPRKSKEYQILLDDMYEALYLNPNFRKALKACPKGTVFTHSMGNNNKKETVLTEQEFCSRLQKLHTRVWEGN